MAHWHKTCLLKATPSREVKPLAAHGKEVHADAKPCSCSLARQQPRSALPLHMPHASSGGQTYAQDLLYTHRMPWTACPSSPARLVLRAKAATSSTAAAMHLCMPRTRQPAAVAPPCLKQRHAGKPDLTTLPSAMPSPRKRLGQASGLSQRAAAAWRLAFSCPAARVAHWPLMHACLSCVA